MLTILGEEAFAPARDSRQNRYKVTLISSIDPIWGSTSSKNPSGTRTVFCLSVENPMKGRIASGYNSLITKSGVGI
jgi:hypothetical protein